MEYEDIRNILGLDEYAGYDEVKKAFEKRLSKLGEDREIADFARLFEINLEISKLNNAWKAYEKSFDDYVVDVTDEEETKREKSKGRKKEKRQRVVDVEEDEFEISEKAKKIFTIMGTSALVIAIMIFAGIGIKKISSVNFNKNGNKGTENTTASVSNDQYNDALNLDAGTIQAMLDGGYLTEEEAERLLKSAQDNKSENVNSGKDEEKETFADKIAGFFGFERKPEAEESKEEKSEPSTEVETQEVKETEEKEDNKEEQSKDETNGKVQFFGDARDDKLVTERATKLVEQLNGAEIINLSTGTNYTVDEIKTLILFMNGAYVPENDAQALGMVDEYLNFCCMDSALTVMMANYNGGEDSFKSEVERLQGCTPKISIVDNMLFGNCKGYGYLKWFENKYQEAIYTTDRDKIQRIYRELSFSLLYLKEGKGYTIDGVTYTMNDFSGLGNINAGNILQYYAYMFQPLNTVMSDVKETDPNTGVEYTYFTDKNTHESYYRFFNEDLSLDRDNEDEYASYEEGDLLSYYNAMCDEETLLSNIAYDDSGYMKLIVSDEEANFSKVLQINTINMALHALYIQDQSYYDELYNNNILRKTK